MNIKNLFLALLGVLVLNQGFAHQEIQPSLEKIYISPDRLLIYPEGIFYIDDAGGIDRAHSLSADHDGLFVLTYYQCSECGWANNDGICINDKCASYGKRYGKR